jgi:hypothetical protein
LTSRQISKSKYLSALQCVKRLWIEIRNPDKVPPPTKDAQRRMAMGTEVGIRARDEFPGGVLIDAVNFSERLHRTEKALAEDVPVIFEAAFSDGEALAVTDVLRRRPDGTFDLIEVKATTSVKPEHLHDLAIQKDILERCGLNVDTASLMHLNPQCTFPDLSNLFVIEDVTPEVEEAREGLPERLSQFRSVLRDPTEPNVPVGDHCRQPYECPLMGYCWAGIGDLSIFHVRGLSTESRAQMLERGIEEVGDIDPDFPLTKRQRRYVERMLDNDVHIDAPAIRAELAGLAYPLYFLDFETDNPAIPRFDGAHPFEHVPFQYSLHVMQESGEVDHAGFLHTDETDPRPGLTRSLLDHIGERGTLIAWYARFERDVLHHLARAFPEHAGRLSSMADRLWDQLMIFKKHYFHPGFKRSQSLKCVVPVLLPSLRCENLEVQNGVEAQIAWSEMIGMPESPDRNRMIKSLEAYCHQDTLVMVEIHRLLAGVSLTHSAE